MAEAAVAQAGSWCSGALGRLKGQSELGLRVVGLAYLDPFTHRRVDIRAPVEGFAREYGFGISTLDREAP